MFFLLDAKITILYLFSMQKLVESLYKSCLLYTSDAADE